jgi:IS605 OrfB family transposase
MLYLTYQFAATQTAQLDPTKILGVDMGIKLPVVVATNDGRFSRSIDGGEIENMRRTINRQKKMRLQQDNIVLGNREGHGRKKKMKKSDAIGNKISNTRELINHKYSKMVVEWALKNKCGVIQMEDLSGISKDNLFLKDWTYFDLQSKIEYKAKNEGIVVIKVEPKYTSQRCWKCGSIDKGSRVSQALFECTTCGHTDNADRNAARNIATQDIEKIVKEWKLTHGG